MEVEKSDEDDDVAFQQASNLPTTEQLRKEAFPVKRPHHLRKIKPPDGTPPRSPGPTRHSRLSSIPKPDVPRFYFPLGPEPSPKDILNERELLRARFEKCEAGGLTKPEFRELVMDVFRLSSFVTECFWLKSGLEASQPMTQEAFWPLYEKLFQNARDPKTRLHLILQDDKMKKIYRRNLEPMVKDIVVRHPGLKFLASAETFHDRYIETVIERIFYTVCSEHSDGITMNSLRNSNFYDCLNLLDIEDDINDIFDYFSYEHFYVIYCKFWELDTDHDFIIDAADLCKYADGSLTSSVCERIVSGSAWGYKLESCDQTLTYKDFIYFIISEEDKTTERSQRFWFRILDTDGDGLLSFFEIAQFWEQQAKKISQISVEEFRYQNLTNQLKDMIRPKLGSAFTLEEIKQSGLAPLFFNMIFNLNKFARHEQRDPYRLEQIRQNPHMSDWDRFAQEEYSRYAEEDADTASV